MATDDSDLEEGHAGGEFGTTRFRTRHDWNDGSEISSTVIDAVAAIVGKEPTELHPLYDVIDPDALDDLILSFLSTDNGDDRARVDFRFNGCDITVRSDGTISVESPL